MVPWGFPVYSLSNPHSCCTNQLTRQMIVHRVLQAVFTCLRSANYSHLNLHTDIYAHVIFLNQASADRGPDLTHATVNQGLFNWDSTVRQLCHSSGSEAYLSLSPSLHISFSSIPSFFFSMAVLLFFYSLSHHLNFLPLLHSLSFLFHQ